MTFNLIALPAHYWITLVVITLVYFGAIRLLLWKHLSLLARQVLIVLVVVSYVLGILNVFAWTADSEFVRWFYDMNQELSIGSMFSSVQLMGVAGCSLLLAGFQKKVPLWQRAFWGLVLLVFVFLSIDEYYELHEIILEASRYYFAITGSVTALLTLAMLWFVLRERAHELGGFLAGLGVIGFFGVIGEPLIWSNLCVIKSVGFYCHRYNLIEEFGEVAGTAIALAALLSLADHMIDTTRLKRAHFALAGIAGLWLVWTGGSQWVTPRPNPAIRA